MVHRVPALTFIALIEFLGVELVAIGDGGLMVPRDLLFIRLQANFELFFEILQKYKKVFLQARLAALQEPVVKHDSGVVFGLEGDLGVELGAFLLLNLLTASVFS